MFWLLVLNQDASVLWVRRHVEAGMALEFSLGADRPEHEEQVAEVRSPVVVAVSAVDGLGHHVAVVSGLGQLEEFFEAEVEKGVLAVKPDLVGVVLLFNFEVVGFGSLGPSASVPQVDGVVNAVVDVSAVGVFKGVTELAVGVVVVKFREVRN